MPKHPPVHIEDVAEPFCGIIRKNTVPLLDAHPEVAAEWFYKKNAGWGPEHLSRGSAVHAWWICSNCNRDYKASICNRTVNGSGCPYCASKRVCEDNALIVFHPEIAAEWHPTRNGKKKVEDFMRASARHVWWLCGQCKHSWKCAISDRTTLDSGCPACYEARMEYARLHPNVHPTPQKILDAKSEPAEWYARENQREFVSLYKFSRALARQWHPTKNGKVTPSTTARGSDAIAWWKCPKADDHEWQAPVYSRTDNKEAGCPFCRHFKLSKSNSLQAKAPALARQWHPTKNGKFKPDQVLAGGDKKVWWRCPKDKSHEWEAKIDQRLKGSGCPDCAHINAAIANKNNCLNNKFAHIAAQLHPTKNGDKNGDNIAAQSGTKVWWICPEGPDHVWMAKPSNRTGRGSGCPACVGRQILITNCLATLSPETAKSWHPTKNGNLSPKDVTPHAKDLVWWLCSDGHAWQQGVDHRTASPIYCWQCLGQSPTGVRAKSTASSRRNGKVTVSKM